MSVSLTAEERIKSVGELIFAALLEKFPEIESEKSEFIRIINYTTYRWTIDEEIKRKYKK